MVYILSLLMTAWVIHRLARRADAKGVRGTARTHGILGLTAGALLAGGLVYELGGINLFILAAGAAVGFVLALGNVLLGWVTLILTWRMLVAAEFQARAVEHEPKLHFDRASGKTSLEDSVLANPED